MYCTGCLGSYDSCQTLFLLLHFIRETFNDDHVHGQTGDATHLFLRGYVLQPVCSPTHRRSCAYGSPYLCSPTHRRNCAYGSPPPYNLTRRNYGMHAHHLHCGHNSIPHRAYALLFPYTLLYCRRRGYAPRSVCNHQFHKDRAGVLLSVCSPIPRRKTSLYLSESLP